MKADVPSLAALSAVIEADLKAMERIDAEMAGLRPRLNSAPPPEFRDLAAAGYLLHNLYNALENTFEQISRTFENHLTDPSVWHKELANKMFLAIPTVRPAVLPEALRRFMNDLRGFRHLFRHAYDFQIDPLRLQRLLAD